MKRERSARSKPCSNTTPADDRCTPKRKSPAAPAAPHQRPSPKGICSLVAAQYQNRLGLLARNGQDTVASQLE
jgi:hypothetical protein